MKLLKDLDGYIIPPGGVQASTSFKNLDEKYFLNKDEEIKKAKEKFLKGEFSSVAEQLDGLSKGIINDNA